VVVVSDQLIMDRGRSLHIDRSTGKVRGEGPGQIRVFDTVIDVSQDERIAPPFSTQPPPAPQLQARWNAAMEIDGNVNDGAGAIEFAGNVEAVSSKSPQQRDTLSGEALRLEFMKVDADEPAAMPEANDGAENDLAGVAQGKRQLSMLIARGDDAADGMGEPAKMESRVWEPQQMIDDAGALEPDPQAKPRVYYVEGATIQHNNISGESLVEGAGKMLTRDLRTEVEGETQAEASPFSSRGTSLFSWTKQLEMKKSTSFADRYEAVMTGGVEILHEDLAGQPSTLTGDELRATFRMADIQPPGHAPAIGAQPVADVVPPPNAMAFGGAMDILRLQGTGNLAIVTPTREVLCDSFDYNEQTKVAEVLAAAGRAISIKSRGSPSPVQAARVLWDMRNDTITIDRMGAGR
jgi:hypothetical protein